MTQDPAPGAAATPAAAAPATPAHTPAPATPAYTEDQTSGRLFVRWNLGTLVLGAAALVAGLAAAPPAPVAPWDPVGLLADPRWDDGKVEAARYVVVRTADGAKRRDELVRLVAAEAHDLARGATAAAPRAAIRTLAVHTAPGAGPCGSAQAVACVLDRRDPRRLLEAALAAHDAWGVTTAHLRRDGAGLARAAHRPLEGERVQGERVDGDVLVEDALPFVLRAVDWDATEGLELRVLPTPLGGGAPVAARVTRAAAREAVTVPAGAFECARVEVRLGGRTATYWVARTGERALVRFDDATGQGELTRLERVAVREVPRE